MTFAHSVLPSAERFLPVHLCQLFDALYRTRSVTGAATALGVSQPSASAGLGKLRTHFKDQLFVRRGGAMHPTPRADELVDTVRDVLEALRTLSADARTFDARSSQRIFRLECPDGPHVTMLPRLFERVRHDAPNVQIAVSMLSESPEESLRADLADLAVTLTSRSMQREFRSTRLTEERWVCLVNADHPFTRSSPTLAEYRSARHISVARSGWSRILDSYLAEASWKRNVALVMPGVLGIPDILATTDLVVTIPHRIADVLARDDRLCTVRCPLQVPTFTVSMYWSHRHEADPGHQWLRNLVSAVL